MQIIAYPTMNEIKITCKCGRVFTWIPVQRYNSTIKPKAPTECRICKNKKLLAQSNFSNGNKRTGYKTWNVPENVKVSLIALKIANRKLCNLQTYGLVDT